MLGGGGIRTAVGAAPDACREIWCGKRLADAWEGTAPARLQSGGRGRT